MVSFPFPFGRLTPILSQPMYLVLPSLPQCRLCLSAVFASVPSLPQCLRPSGEELEAGAND